MNNTESSLYDLIWSPNVDRRINAAIELDRATRAAVVSLSSLLTAYLGTERTQPRQIQEAAEAIHDLSGLVVELDLSWNVRLPALQNQSTTQAGD